MTGWLTTDDAAPRPVMTVPGEGAARRAAEELYEGTSSLPLRRSWGKQPTEFCDYLRVIYEGGNCIPLELEDSGPAEPWFEAQEDGTCWVLFTGGKDSVAAALRAEEQGLRPRLLHVRGLNRGVSDEVFYAQTIAAERGWEMHVEEISIVGRKVGFLECPTKNQASNLVLLANMQERGGAIWTAGYHAVDRNEVQGFTYDYSDGVETIAAFLRYLEARAPGSRYIGDLADTVEAWAICAEAGLLGYIKGCYAPLRFKRQYRERNEAKFGPLLPGRCGSCIKCAWEQVALEELGILEPNPGLRASQAKFILRDFAERAEEPTLQSCIDFLLPPESLEQHRRDPGFWPEQLTPPWAPLPESTSWQRSDV